MPVVVAPYEADRGVAGLGAVTPDFEPELIFGSSGLKLVEIDQEAGLDRGFTVETQITIAKQRFSKETLDIVFFPTLAKLGYTVVSSSLESAPFAARWEGDEHGYQFNIKVAPSMFSIDNGLIYLPAPPTVSDSEGLPTGAQIYRVTAKPTDGAMTKERIAALGPVMRPIMLSLDKAVQRDSVYVWAMTLITVRRIVTKSYWGIFLGVLGVTLGVAAIANVSSKNALR